MRLTQSSVNRFLDLRHAWDLDRIGKAISLDASRASADRMGGSAPFGRPDAAMEMGARPQTP